MHYLSKQMSCVTKMNLLNHLQYGSDEQHILEPDSLNLLQPNHTCLRAIYWNSLGFSFFTCSMKTIKCLPHKSVLKLECVNC